MANTIEILVTARNLTKGTFDETARQARSIGQQTGTEFSKGIEDKIEDEVPGAAKRAGERAGFNFSDAFGGRVRDDLTPAVDEPLNDLPTKGREKGKETGKEFSNGLSPLLLSAFTGAAALGPAALLGGVATATVGIAALVSKSNIQIGQDYATLGQQVSSTFTNAVAPIAGNIDAAVITLEQGVSSLGPQLDQLFAAAGPDATQLASALDRLAEGALPGIVRGVQSAAPFMHDLAVDAGKIGQGIGGLITGLSGGVGGATTGFNALATSLSQILPDLGQIVGDLANGLGPALRDILVVATPLANAFAGVVHAIPPGDIEAAAVAVTALFAAFKIGTLTNVVAEGTTFVQFLRGATVASREAAVATAGLGVAEEEVAVQTGLLAKAQAGAAVATGAMSSAAAAATGPWGALAAALLLATDQIEKHTKLTLDPIKFVDTVYKAYHTHVTAIGDTAKEVASIAGVFTTATGRADLLTQALTTQRNTISSNAQTTATATLAALGATDGQSKLTQELYGALTGYSAATTGASAYTAALDAMNGTTATLDDAQNNLAQQMLNAKTSFAQNGYSMDLNTQSGINNREALSAAAKAITQVGIAQYQATGDIGKANGTIQQQIDVYVKSTGATGKAKKAIEDYLLSLAKIPPDVSTSVDLDTKPAYGKLAKLLKTINTSSGVIHVTETLSGTVNNSGFGRGFGAKATGGITGGIGAAASGGVRGSLTWVGEQGPELVRLPFGTQVFSAPDSQRALSQQVPAGGSGGPLQVEFAGGLDQAFASAFMALIRSGKIQIKQKAIVA